jgi:hypothetical protein
MKELEHDAEWWKRKFRCRICGLPPDAAEAIIFSVFENDPAEVDICIDCHFAAHLKRHPGLSCCEARLGHDEGCYDKTEKCSDYYIENGCPNGCGKYSDDD